jgi:hypothetical protein
LIDTTTTSSFAARATPEYHGIDPAPPVKPPPWIHTITGRPRSSQAGVVTLRERQSSPWAISPAPSIASSPPITWSDIAPKVVASRTSDHGSTGWGGLQRSGPTGAAANGMPLNRSTPPFSAPRTFPDVVVTITAPRWCRALPSVHPG